MKKITVLLVVFLSWVSVASASLEVTEVMYNPTVKTDHLWIKVFNNSDSDVNLAGWSVADYDGTAWHYHAINADSSSMLSAGSYATIAKASATTLNAFKTKNPDITDLLFYGNLTIENEGTIGVSLDKKSVIGKLLYGGEIATTVDIPEAGDIPEDIVSVTSSSNSSSSSTKDYEKILKINTKIISPKIAVAGIPISISSLTTTNRNETYNFGKFVWNFGDGMSKEVKESEPFDYIYNYPGDYILSLSYFDNSFTKVSDAISRVNIKVIPSDIYISSVGSESDPYIEIENKSKYEVLLSGWIVKGGDKSFIFPEDTTLMQGKKIKLSPKITNFDVDDIRYITILNPNKEIVSTYPRNNIDIVKNIIPSKNVSYSKKSNSEVKDPQVINLNDLGASAADSKVNISKMTYSIIGLIVIIILGIISFLFVKNKKEIPDYVERGVSAKDMTIIE